MEKVLHNRIESVMFAKVGLIVVFLCMHQCMVAQWIQNYNNSVGKDFTYIPVTNGTQMGFVDRQNKVFVPAQYDAVSFFDSLGLAVVKKDGLYGIIDMQKKEVIPLMSKDPIGNRKVSNYEDDPFNSTSIKDLYVVQGVESNNWLVFAPRHQRRSSAVYTKGLPRYEDRLSSMGQSAQPNLFSFGYRKIDKENGLVNFIDTSFNEVLTKDVVNGTPVSPSLFAVLDEQGRAGLMKKNGTYSIPPVYNTISTSGLRDVFLVTTIGSWRGLVNADGLFLLDSIYTQIYYLQHDQFIVTMQGGRAIIDLKRREIVTKNAYNDYTVLTKGLYSATRQDQYFIVDTAGLLKGGPFTALSGNDRYDLVHGHRGDSTFYFNAQGKFLFAKPAIQKVNYVTTFGIDYTENGKSGMMDRKGVVHLEPVYSSIVLTDIEDAVVVTNDNSETGLFSIRQKWIIPMQKEGTVIFAASTSLQKVSFISWNTRSQSTMYTGTLKNPEVKSIEQSSIRTYTITEDADKKVITLLDGRRYTYPNEDEIRPVSNGKVVCFEKRINGRRYILNTELKPILPDGFFVDGIAEYKESFAFVIKNDNFQTGLYHLDGSWLIKPGEFSNIQRMHTTFWKLGTYDAFQLCTDDFKPITKTIYKEFKIIEDRYIIAYYKEGKLIDVFDTKGRLLSEGQYSDFIGHTKNEVTCAKHQNDELISCVTDTLWREKQCYPFAEIKLIESKPDLLIAKDLYDYGVTNRKGEVVIPFHYKDVYYYEAVDLFKVRKGMKVYDFLTPSGQRVIADANGMLNASPLGEGFMLFAGDENRYVFNTKTGKHIVVPLNMGVMIMDSRFAGSDLLTLQQGSKFTYMDANTGVVYKIE